MLFFSKLSELSEIEQSYLWSPGWCPAYKYGGFLWGVRWLWNHFRAILLKPVLPRNTDSSRVDVVKGEAEEKDTMLNSFNTNGTFPSWFFPLNFLQKSLSSKFSEILWESVPVAPPGCFMPAINHSIASQSQNVQCAGRWEGPHRWEVFTSQWLNGSSFQISEPACPNPITSRVSREKEKSQNIGFEKDIKLTGSAVCVPLPCTFRQLYEGSWHIFSKTLDIVADQCPLTWWVIYICRTESRSEGTLSS